MEWSGSDPNGVWFESYRAERLFEENIRSDTGMSPSQKNGRTSSSHLNGVSAVCSLSLARARMERCKSGRVEHAQAKAQLQTWDSRACAGDRRRDSILAIAC
jgi:hypothetical protein